MATPPRTTEQEDVFGVMQTLLLVVILVVGALLITLPLFAVKIGDKSLAVVISALLPMKDLPWLPALLWVVEAAVYALIGWSLTRQIPAAVGAIVLGFVTRIIVCVLIALLLTTQESSSLPTILGNMHGNYWPYRIFALIPAWLALQWPFLPLLASGFGMNTGATSSVTKAAVKAAPKGGASGFAFNTTKAPGARPTTTTAFPTRSASRDDARPVHTLTPPADFVMPNIPTKFCNF